MTPTIDIVWENTDYTPTNGREYLEAWLLPAVTLPVTLGPNCWEEYAGIYQISCVYPAGKGRGAAKEKAGKIANYFARGTSCTYNDITVKIRQAYPAPGYYDSSGSWYRIPVSIVYFAFST
jgi:hypothetical protein